MTDSAKRERVRRILIGVLLFFLVLGVAGFAWLWFAPCGFGGCAPVSDLEEYQAEGSELLDINGEPFAVLATVNRRIVSLDSLPDFLPQAFLAVEDQRFYDHSGVDWKRMAGAVTSTARAVAGAGGNVEGGSTITMQLARNLFPEHLPYTERSIRRKAMEIRVARQIEREFPKDKILELYLNHIYLGAGAYGVEAAARTYFGRPAAELTLAEAATLGALPQAPSQINPRKAHDRALSRRNLVLSEMADAGYVSAAEAEEAREQPLELATPGDAASGPESSYFVERVRRALESELGDRFYTAGLKVYTTLDPDAQAAAEEELARQLDAIESGRYGTFRHPTYPEAKGVAEETGRTPYLQGAFVLLEAETGEVRALVGGRDFEDSKFDRATQASRQPGSAFKPFVYLTAIERGRSPIHTLEDAPIQLTLAGNRVWEPKNYTGRYDGPMTLRDALTRSKNMVTVRLAQELGMSSIIRTAHDVGIESEIPAVPSAALGAAEVRPIELVAAYAPLANGGARIEPRFIRRVEDRNGNLLWEAEAVRQPVIDPATAFVMTTMLRDVIDRGTGRAVRAAFGGPAAGKTGTTNDATDVWFIGYTPDLVGGVWMGFDDPQTIVRGASGSSIAAPVWGRVINRVYQGRTLPAAWRQPPGVVTAEVEQGTGVVISEWCPARGPTYTEYFVNVAPTQTFCNPRDTLPLLVDAERPWTDEEWENREGWDDDPDRGVEERASGIYWPELDTMVQRSGRPDSDPPPPPPPAVPPADEPAPRIPIPDTATVGEPPLIPDLLGEPLPRDTTSS